VTQTRMEDDEMSTNDRGASASGPGYPATPEPASGLGPAGGYPSRDPWHLESYDDGTSVSLSGYSGGGSPEGLWGGLTLIRTHPDGRFDFRRYCAIGDWDGSLLPPPASGIEARSDETRSGSAEGESAVGEAETPRPSPDTNKGGA
jgi:hypothetical protein